MTTRSATLNVGQLASAPGAEERSLRQSVRRRRLLKFITLVISVGVGLAICETIMRVYDLGETRPVALYNNEIFKIPPHERITNYIENPNSFLTNNLGFHDHEREARNEKYRILVLGDSFVEGRQVQTDSLFTVRLEQKLSSDGQKFETINGGVSGTGSAYQYSLWKYFFEPQVKVDHLVVCFFMGNDLIDNNRDLRLSNFASTDSDIFIDRNGQIIDGVPKPGAVKRVINYFRRESRVMNLAYVTAYRITQNLQDGTSAASLEVRGPRANTAWEDSEAGTIALIKRWHLEMANKKIPFDIILIDRPSKVYNKFERDFIERLRTTSEREQIGYLHLKLTEYPFESYSFDEINLGHFNDKGHELAARELNDYFRARYSYLFKGSSR
jgi:lysophospholipase L1-like esterase